MQWIASLQMKGSEGTELLLSCELGSLRVLPSGDNVIIQVPESLSLSPELERHLGAGWTLRLRPTKI